MPTTETAAKTVGHKSGHGICAKCFAVMVGRLPAKEAVDGTESQAVR